MGKQKEWKTMRGKLEALIIILFLITPTLFSAEIDQLTDREKYEETARDFTPVLNRFTNRQLEKAVGNFNSLFDTTEMEPSEVHKQMAFQIYKATAGSESDRYSEEMPTRINLFYALGKSGHGPIQTWIQREENREWWIKLKENIYSDLYPEPLNQNYIIKVAGEFLGPDKIDHFFDQGYSYWLISRFGENDKAALTFGVETEIGWYGLRAGGIFSFADLRANWEGYRFFIDLFDKEKGHLTINGEGSVEINRPFDWTDYIDWQYDELKNPSVITEINLKKINRYIWNHYDQYCETYNYLKESEILEWASKRDSYYFTEDLTFSNAHLFDFSTIMSEGDNS